MSMLRVWLEYAWKQPRVWLEYAYSMPTVCLETRNLFPYGEQNIPTLGTKHSQPGNKTGFLRPFSSKRAELERRLLVSLFLMLILGSTSVWGQTDYSGTYYIKSVSTNKQTTGDYYLCPTEGWAFFVSDDTNPGTVQDDDNGKPFLTTYHCKNGSYDATKAIWIIKKAPAPNSDYYYIIQEKTVSYMVSNGPICGNPDRARVHLEKIDNPEDLGDKALFSIYVPNDKDYCVIKPKGITDTNSDAPSGHSNHSTHKWLTVNQGNKDNLAGTDAKKDGPSSFPNTGGIICLYTESDANAPFNLEIPTPTFSFNSDNKVEIAEMESVEVYYTTDGSDPEVPAAGQEPTGVTTKYTAAISLNANNQLKIKAIATNKDHSITSSIITYIYTCDITLENTSFEYNGTEIQPTISSVKIGEEEVPSDRYDVKCTDVNVGTATLTLSGKAGSDYVVQGSKTFTITPRTVTLDWPTELPYTKAAQTPVPTITNLVTGDECTVTVSVTGGEAINMGSYTATATALTGSSSANYQLPDDESLKTCSFNIVPATLTVTAEAKEKVYGDPDPEFTYTEVTGFIGDDNVSLLSGSLSRADVDNQNVGEYAITAGNLSAGPNYTISVNDAKLTITPAPLTITADNKSKNYVEADPALTFTVNTLKYSDTNEDVFTGELTRETGVEAGSYKITQGTLALKEGVVNYTIPENGFVEGVFTIVGTVIDPAPTVSLAGWTYGSPNNPSVSSNPGYGKVTYKYKGRNQGADKYTTTKPTNYGTYHVIAEIAAKGGYEAATTAPVEFTISKAPLTIKADAQVKDYLDVDPELTYNVMGLKYSDVEKNVITCVLGRESGEAVGTYNITKTEHTFLSSNYSLGSFEGSTLTINKKNLGSGGNPESGITIGVYQSGETWTVSMYNGKNAFLTTDFTYAVSEADTDGNRTITVTASGDNCTGSTIITYSNYTFPIVVGTDEKACPYYVAENDLRSSPDVIPYIVNKVNPSVGTISISPISYIPKDVPVLLLTRNEATGLSLSPKKDDESISKYTLESNRLLYSSEGAVPVADAEAYLFYNGEFVLTKAGSIKQDRFYIYNPNYAGETEDTSSAPAPSRELRIIRGNTNTTGLLMLIDNAQPKTSEDRWYSLDGRQLTGKPITKGLYINNGHKVVIK